MVKSNDVIMRDRNGGKPNNGQRCPLFGLPPPQPAPAHYFEYENKIRYPTIIEININII